MKAKIYIDRSERPRFYPARQVPFAIRQKVEEELERLQALGIYPAGPIRGLGSSYRPRYER